MANDKPNPRPSEMEELKAQLVEQQAQLTQAMSLINALKAPQAISSTDLLAQEVRSQRRRDQQKESFQQWVSKSAEERTQEEADRRYPTGTGRFRVWVIGEMKGVDELGRPTKSSRELPTDCPKIEINAHSIEEARERYKVLCGLTWLKGATLHALHVGEPRTFDFGPPAYDLTPPREPSLAR